jgi:hypothetical protein
MNAQKTLENAFGLRWLEDDALGRVIYGSVHSVLRSPAEAIALLGLGCDEGALRQSLDHFPPHLRIHGGYTPFVGDPATRFTLTWEPGAGEARFIQTTDGSDETMSGRVEIAAGGSLKDALMDLLVPDAQDVVGEARDRGRVVALKDVDFWVGDRHFRVPNEDPSGSPPPG